MLRIFTALPCLPEVTHGLVRIEPPRRVGRKMGGDVYDVWGLLGGDPMQAKQPPYSLDAAIEMAERFRANHPELLYMFDQYGQVYGE